MSLDWDFNDLIWHDTSVLDPSAADWFAGGESDGANAGLPAGESSAPVQPGFVTSAGATQTDFALSRSYTVSTGSHHPGVDASSPASSVDGGSHALVEHFLASDVPPILASIEVGPRWTSTKALFASLASQSSMVRHAITAFSALQLEAQNPAVRTEHQMLHSKASGQLSSYVVRAQREPTKVAEELSCALAAAFFLSYADCLTSRVNNAHGILRDAATLVRVYKDTSLALVEKRLISWIRLVDGRLSSAGGDGAFLTETDGDAFSPEVNQRPESAENKLGAITQDADLEIQEILFDILYSPGLAFYQRVQSIMARVSNIDPWHRSRGTVRDETEVMAIAATISTDLRMLEKQRPALMDHAVAGSLGERHLAKDIALAVTRSYRTYWANYEAGFIHLHRVAHKHLPATQDVIRARSTIKRIVRLFAQSGVALPTNFIWPLLMACCEEDEFGERTWMIAAIRSMQGIACNARPIADVLEEVHKRQDATKQRADVRQCSLDLFNMSFAVV